MTIAKKAIAKDTKNRLATLTTFAALVCIAPASAGQASLSYSTHLGGSEDDQTSSIVVAPNGDRVFCGSAESAGLATAGAFQASPAGRADIIVGRYAADDKSLVFLTYFGGTGEDACTRIALDSAGNIVFIGRTASPDFPTFNAQDSTYAGGGLASPDFEGDAFVAKMSGDGSTVVFSTYLGGVDLDFTGPNGYLGRETARGLSIDDDDRIIVVGETGAPDFPATSVLGDGECGMDPFPPVDFVFIGDQFVARYQPDGSQDFAVCISGNARDAGRGVTLDDNGQIYMVGHTRSTNYPTTQPGIGPGGDASSDEDTVVTVLDADATQILRSVIVGGLASDLAQTIKINSAGQLLVQGTSTSEDFPTTAGAWQPDVGLFEDELARQDVVVFGLSPELDELLFSTYVGGAQADSSVGFALDGDQPVLSMSAGSRGLPVINPIQSDKSGDMNGFFPVDIGGTVAFANLRDLTAQPSINGIGAAGPGVNRLYLFNNAEQTFGLPIELPGGAADSRDIVITDINFDSRPDILIGNYEAQNLLYLGTGPAEFAAPIPFGDPQSKTTALGAPEAGCVIEFVEDGENLQHPYQISFGSPFAYGAGTTASRDVVGFNDYLLEISAPDEITLYRGCSVPGVSPVLDTATFAGRDLVQTDQGNLDAASGVDAVFADRNGGGMVIPNFLADGLNAPTINFDGPPTNAIGIARAAVGVTTGVVTAHDDRYRYYRLTSPTSLELDTEQIVATPAAVLYTGAFVSPPQILAGTADGIVQTKVEQNAEDLYVIRLTPDLSDATFATYLGGPGEEFGSFGVEIVGPGQYVFSGSTRSAGFPVSNTAVQAMSGGRQDGVFVELNLGESDPDTDEDGVPDAIDNCTLVANPDQRDTNADGFGNFCDPDLNNDNIVNVLDLGLLRTAFFGMPGAANWNPDADFNGDDVVNVSDLGVLRGLFFAPPGPAAATQ